MAQINVNTERLLRVAAHLEAAGEDLRDYSGSMVTVGDNVEAAWKSQSSGTYVEETQVVSNNMKKLSNEASEIARAIRNYVAELKRVEQQNASMFNG